MKTIHLTADCPEGLTNAQIRAALSDALAGNAYKSVLLVVPDYTRYHSNAGFIANHIYHDLENACRVDLLVALGTHVPMTRGECEAMYGDIPFERFIMHDWRRDVVTLGEVPGEFVREVSEGLVDTAIPVEVNKRLVSGEYDLILSIGQVVPHEVVGMANHAKNLFVGVGGSAMINASHMLGAFYGMERMMGKDRTPVRRVFDYALERFLSGIPLVFALTVTTAPQGEIVTHGLFIDATRAGFEKAVALARQKNMTVLDKPLAKVVVHLDAREFKSTWLGNKSVYRTRMAIQDGGELIVLAPGVEKFGEDAAIDALIRKYGYCGRENVIALCKTNADLNANLSAAAHLIHGSPDGRFTVTYCTRNVTQAEIEGVCYRYLPYEEAARRYDPAILRDGFNTLPDGEEIYYISNPALGLWTVG